MGVSTNRLFPGFMWLPLNTPFLFKFVGKILRFLDDIDVKF
jgi:hypothetical protein